MNINEDPSINEYEYRGYIIKRFIDEHNTNGCWYVFVNGLMLNRSPYRHDLEAWINNQINEG